MKSTRLGVTRFFLITKSTRFCITRFCEFSKKYSVIFTRFLLFDQKVLGWSLLGYPSVCKKYSVKVYSVIALFYESTQLSQSPWLRAKNVGRGGGYLERTRWYPNLRSLPLIKSDNIFGLFFVRFSLSPFGP